MRVTWLLDGQLAASGMIYSEDLEEIERLGITAVLSLTTRSPFDSPPPPGLAHLHLPVADMSCPGQESLERAVSFLHRQIEEGGRALVHCGAGLGRTGTVLACFLVHRGMRAENAIRAVRAARPGAIETAGQEAGIREFGRIAGGRKHG